MATLEEIAEREGIRRVPIELCEGLYNVAKQFGCTLETIMEGTGFSRSTVNFQIKKRSEHRITSSYEVCRFLEEFIVKSARHDLSEAEIRAMSAGDLRAGVLSAAGNLKKEYRLLEKMLAAEEKKAETEVNSLETIALYNVAYHYGCGPKLIAEKTGFSTGKVCKVIYLLTREKYAPLKIKNFLQKFIVKNAKDNLHILAYEYLAHSSNDEQGFRQMFPILSKWIDKKYGSVGFIFSDECRREASKAGPSEIPKKYVSALFRIAVVYGCNHNMIAEKLNLPEGEARGRVYDSTNYANSLNSINTFLQQWIVEHAKQDLALLCNAYLTKVVENPQEFREMYPILSRHIDSSSPVESLFKESSTVYFGTLHEVSERIKDPRQRQTFLNKIAALNSLNSRSAIEKLAIKEEIFSDIKRIAANKQDLNRYVNTLLPVYD